MDKKQKLEKINEMVENTLVKNLGIIITDLGDSFICGKMPVNKGTIQPYGLLHGGASVALAESLGSIAGNLNVDMNKQTVVGIEINASHLKSVRRGWVYGRATPLTIGRKIQVWNIKIINENNDLICESRLTLAVVTKK